MTIAIGFFAPNAPLLMPGVLHAAHATASYSDGPITLINANGGGAWSVGAGTPYWMSLNVTTGVFSGTPSYVLTAAGWVRAATPGKTYASPALTLGDAAGGGTWTMGSGAPAWLTINASTGVLGGSP